MRVGLAGESVERFLRGGVAHLQVLIRKEPVGRVKTEMHGEKENDFLQGKHFKIKRQLKSVTNHTKVI